MGISIVSNVYLSCFQLLWIILLWTLMYKFLCGLMFSFLLSIYIGMKLLSHMTTLCSTFWGIARLFSKEAIPSYIPTEVGDRWASRPDSWYLSSGVKLKLPFSPDTPRTKLMAGAELSWSKEMRWPHPRSKNTSQSVHVQEGSLGVKKVGSATPQ